MGIFDLKFRRSSSLPREEWAAATLAISVGFEAARREIYPKCVEVLAKEVYEGKRLPGVVFSDNVQGLKIKGFQLYLASYLIAKRGYIKPQLGKDFADLLWSQILGTQVVEGIEQVKEFMAGPGALPDIYKLFYVMAADIIGKANQVDEMVDGLMLLNLLGVTFVSNCISVLATVFKEADIDKVTQEETLPFDEIISGLMERFEEWDDKNKAQ